MAVRFLPDPGERPAEAAEDRGDLAEVIELRAMLRRREWGASSEAEASPVESPETEAEAELDADAEAGVEAEAGRGRARVGSASAAPHHGPRSEGGDERPSANADGVRILARRARSSGELRDELLRLEHDPHEVENVIAEFESSHYLDDLGLARVLTEKLRASKRASRSQIRIKLRERKLPDAVIDEAVGELDVDEEFALLRETAQDRARKLGGLDRQTAERRLLGFLARRGWSGEPAMRAARDALDGASRGGGASSGAGGGVRFR